MIKLTEAVLPEGFENLLLRISVTKEDIERFFKACIKKVITKQVSITL